MTSSKSAFLSLLLFDGFALPILLVMAQFSPTAGVVGGLLVMLVHPLLFWRLDESGQE